MNKKIILLATSVVTLLFMAFFAFTVVLSTSLDDQLEIAKDAFDKENYEESIDMYLTILEADPYHVQARLGLVKAYFTIGKLDLVESTLLEGINLQPKEAAFYLNLADFYLFQHDIIQAIATAEQGMNTTNHPELTEWFKVLEGNISITMKRPLVQTGFSREISLTWYGSNGPIPIEAAWDVDDENIGKITTENNQTLFSALTVGTTTVHATLGTLSVEKEVEVRDEVLEEIKLLHDLPREIVVGQQVEISLAGYDAAGNEIDFRPQWSLKSNLGTLSAKIGLQSRFTAEKSGREIIVISFEDMEKEIPVIIDGDSKYLTYETSGQGTIVISPQQEAYALDSEVTIRAEAADGWEFVEWSGDVTGSTNPLTLKMDDHKTIQAIFKANAYPLTIKTEGEGEVLRSSLSTSFSHGETITLTARAKDGWKFVRWQGNSNSTASQLSIVMDNEKSVTAVFTRDSTTTMPPNADSDKQKEQESQKTTLSTTVTGEGRVGRNPSRDSYDKGTTVTLEATPNQGWRFDRWEGDASGKQNPLSVKLDRNKSIRAIFVRVEQAPPTQYTLETAITGNGVILKDKQGTTFPEGTEVRLTASASDGWEFVRWDGVSSQSATITVTMNSNRKLTAVFERNQQETPQPPVEEETIAP